MSNSNYNLFDADAMHEDGQSNRNVKICGLCNINSSRYCCPKCEIFYCSLDCYKSEKHSVCSENFYRDCVNEELAGLNVDDDSRNKTIEILKRMQADEDFINGSCNLDSPYDESDGVEDSDDDAADELEKRVRDLDLNDADVTWKALTEDEKNEFRALCSGGDVTSLIPPWEPWWMFSKQEKLVQDIDDKDEEEEALMKCPDLKSVTEFGKLTTVQPSPAIKMNIANVLASYAFITRYFNGEVEPVEGSICFLMICANLDTNTNFEELATAVESVAQKCLQSDFIETDQDSIEVMKLDTFLILQGASPSNRDHYSKSALSHLHKIFNEAKKAEKDRETSQKDQEMTEKDQEMSAKDQEMSEKDQEMSEKDQQMSEKDQGLPEMRSEKSDKNEFSKIFPDHKREHLPPLEAGKLKRCMKKLEYYLSYIQSYGMDFD